MPKAITATPRPEKRVPSIDLLRGLCIVAVVLHHINLRIPFRDSRLGQLIGPAANRALFWNGYYGVRMFFVISGFLITSWSLKRWGGLSHINLRQFYVMRFARIVPCLAALLLILSAFDRLGIPRFVINTQHTSLTRALLAALTFHVNWLEARTGYLPASWDVLWSLSVEEVFYLGFPLLCVVLRKQALLTSLLTCFVLIGPYARVHSQNELWSDYGYFSCMDGIAFGCLAALVETRITLSSKANLAFRIGGTFLCLLITVFRGTAARLGLYKAGLDVTVMEIGTMLLLIALQKTYEAREDLDGDHERLNPGLPQNGPIRFRTFGNALFRSTAFLRWFGRNSYEVYLTHMFTVWPMVTLFFYFHQSRDLAPFWFFGTAALAGVIGYMVARFYSEPLNHRLRNKLSQIAQKGSPAAAD